MTQAKYNPGYFRVDAEGIVRDWDEEMASMLGYQPGDIIGVSMEVLIPESYRERHWAGFRRAMSRGATVHDQPALNVPLRSKEGSLAQYAAREIFLRDAFGSSVGVLVIVNDKTDDIVNELASPYSDALEKTSGAEDAQHY
ncbi:MAG: PAS domain-containing protein [bacterium]|nr:PAS domain S-box protein [Gammaproteobacteria bacterium]HIL97837.1 PAS domain S-box protein [Pseudomonadales bacterium]